MIGNLQSQSCDHGLLELCWMSTGGGVWPVDLHQLSLWYSLLLKIQIYCTAVYINHVMLV